MTSAAAMNENRIVFSDECHGAIHEIICRPGDICQVFDMELMIAMHEEILTDRDSPRRH
jgi:hypothetical protein